MEQTIEEIQRNVASAEARVVRMLEMLRRQRERNEEYHRYLDSLVVAVSNEEAEA